jgi:CHASE2 domain-containing sensor protein
MFNEIDHKALDAHFRLRGSAAPPTNIAIVALDQRSLAYLNERPPIDRRIYAQLLDLLRASNPKVLAIDIQFIGATSSSDDEAVVRAVERDGPVVLATHEGVDGPLAVPAGQAYVNGAVVASAAIDVDADNVVRHMLRAPVALKTFAVRVAESYLGHEIPASSFPHNRAWIDFQGSPGTFHTYSLSDVLQRQIPASAFTGKIVLVGVTDPVEDVFLTAASSNPMPGVELQANAAETILDGFPLRSTPSPFGVVIAIALATIPIVLIRQLPALAVVAGSLAAGLLFLALTQLAFASGWIVPTMSPITALLLAAVGCVAVDSFINGRQRRQLEQTLGNLLPPSTPAAFFISYRRQQDAWAARDIRAELTRRFGETSVFLDKQSIDTGETWPDRLAQATRWCSVMLVLIGPTWLEGARGRRRIDDPADWVRLEIEAVLQRQDAILIPILLNGAHSPTAAELPESIKALAERQAFALAGEDLHTEVDALVASIERNRLREHMTVIEDRQTRGEGVPVDEASSTK